MGKQDANLLTTVDLGSAKTCVLVADVAGGLLRYAGHGAAESRGSRKGAIVDLDKAVASVQRAVEEAEAASGRSVESAWVGVAGAHIRGVNSRGGIALGNRPREISRDDVRDAVDKARAIALPPDRQVLHILPQEFIVDDEAGIRDPLGMIGSRLAVQVHLVTASSSAVQNVVTVLNRAGLEVEDVVYEPLAAADAVLKPDERELGVALVDLGAGSADVVTYCEGTVSHSGVVPVGGDHFTSDVSVGLRTPLYDAEKVKRLFGCAIAERIPDANEIEVPTVGDRGSRMMPQRLLADILEPRGVELMEMLADALEKARVLELCGAGVVLTGGAARLNGLVEQCERILKRPARLGVPAPIAGMPAALAEPEYAALVGMALYAHRSRLARRPPERGIVSKLKSLFAKTAD